MAFFDTAGAAKSLAEEEPKHIGAIASAYAAKLYKLKVLRSNLQNLPNNFTRFLAIKSGVSEPRPPSRKSQSSGQKPYKTSIVFIPEKNQTGILFRMLGVFALRDIDLLKIESRPNPLSPFEYWFYVDFVGAVGESKVDKALDHLREMAAQLKVLGSYPRTRTSNHTEKR